MIALLDTNVVIALGTEAERRPDLAGFADYFVSALTWSELTKGLHTPSSIAEYKVRRARLDRSMGTYGDGIPFDDDCISAYDRILQRVSARGGSVRAHPFDRMIAATAMAHDMTVVTRDLSGFAGLEGLVRIELR